MQYRSLKNLSDLVKKNIAGVPRVDVVAGIPKSGMILASMIAALSNQPLANVSELITNSWRESKHGGRWNYPLYHPRTILLVDDSVSGGETIFAIKSELHRVLPDARIITLVAYRKPNSPSVDIALETLEADRVFEWNWFKHKRHLGTAVLDIDGVISTPTTPDYRMAGKPLFIPRRKVLAIATGRREWEWEDTERWLKLHNVEYGGIFYSSDVRSGRQTKLEAAIEMNAKWIVESDAGQAAWLRAHTGLPVLCIDTNEMY